MGPAGLAALWISRDGRGVEDLEAAHPETSDRWPVITKLSRAPVVGELAILARDAVREQLWIPKAIEEA
jgi:hypothetical protein